jgi:3-dehydroquinate synthase
MGNVTDILILNVELGERSYPIYIGEGLIADASRAVGYAKERSCVQGRDGGALFGISDCSRWLDLSERVCVITDENVYSIYGESLEKSLENAEIDYDIDVIHAGEGSKSKEHLSIIYDYFGEDGRLSRKGTVVAFGGGVVGDLAGFAAATWMRGVRFVQIPTTLLAQIDSSVGGKTAIDTARGKNLVGAFYQPSLVVIDTSLLRTLPEREYRAGMAEMIKYGAISSRELFDELDGDEGIGFWDFAQNDTFFGEISKYIYECCRIKSLIVAEDELDNGRRAILNFGHTFGHAIEAKYGFEKYNHGEAVAAGMRIAARIGEKLGVTEQGTAARIDSLLDKLGLPSEDATGDLIELIKNDKKAGSDGVDFVLLHKIGDAFVKRLSYEELKNNI